MRYNPYNWKITPKEDLYKEKCIINKLTEVSNKIQLKEVHLGRLEKEVRETVKEINQEARETVKEINLLQKEFDDLLEKLGKRP